MRHLLWCALFAILAAPVVAQEYATDRGSLLLDGSAQFYRQNTDFDGRDSWLTVVQIQPAAQWFVQPGVAVGGRAVFLYSSRDRGGSATIYGLGPIISYYYGGPEQSYYPFVSARFLFLDPDEGDISLSYGASAGALFMLSRAVGLSTSLALDRSTQGDAYTTQFGLSVGVAAFIF